MTDSILSICVKFSVKASVHDFVLPVARNLIRPRRPGVTEDPPDLATETLLIELECCLALSVETQIRDHLHGKPLGDERSLTCCKPPGAGRARDALGVSLSRVSKSG